MYKEEMEWSGRAADSLLALDEESSTMPINLWRVEVQAERKPYWYKKSHLLVENISQADANKIYEKAIKHPHIDINVLWMCLADELKYNVPAQGYVFLENYEWRPV